MGESGFRPYPSVPSEVVGPDAAGSGQLESLSSVSTGL